MELEWPQLIEKVRAEMEKGTPPESPEVQQLTKRWKELVQMFTGGNPGIEDTLRKRYQEVPEYGAQYGLDPKLFAYVGQAMKSE